MAGRLWKKCVNYETVSYVICGVLTTAVDFFAYGLARTVPLSVEVSQALSWLAAVLFAYIVNKLVVFRNFQCSPGYLAKEAGTFFAARIISGVGTWVLMIVLVRLGGSRGLWYELLCKMISSAVNLIANYIFSKFWIFRNAPGER